MKKQIQHLTEEIYKEECLNKFPEFIRVDGIDYKQVAGKTINDTYEFDYVGYNGNFVNWKFRLCEFHEDDYDTIFRYVNKFLKGIKHEVLSEIVTKDILFHRELSQLINRYSKEIIGGDTPDYIIAGYLIRCLENLGITTNKRMVHKGE